MRKLFNIDNIEKNQKELGIKVERVPEGQGGFYHREDPSKEFKELTVQEIMKPFKNNSKEEVEETE